MKYDDFKIFKFSTISKNINPIRDSFSRIYKRIKNINSKQEKGEKIVRKTKAYQRT